VSDPHEHCGPMNLGRRTGEDACPHKSIVLPKILAMHVIPN